MGQEKSKTVYDLSRDLPAVKLYGPQADTVARREPEGLRVKLAATRKDRSPVGVEIPVNIKGAFDASFGYELLKIGEPVSKYGAGVAIRVHFDTPDSRPALISRTRRPNGENSTAFMITKKPEGNDDYKFVRELKPMSSKGRLGVLANRRRRAVLDQGRRRRLSPDQGHGNGRRTDHEGQRLCHDQQRADGDGRALDRCRDRRRAGPAAAQGHGGGSRPHAPTSPQPGGRGRLLVAAGIVIALLLGALGIYWIRRSRT